MKKTISLFLVLLVLTLTACGAKASSAGEDTSAGQTSVADDGAPAVQIPSSEDTSSDEDEGVDLDLTQLSSTMVYAQIYDMICSPDSYMGKTVRIKGFFTVFEDGDKLYYACVVQDATACCAQGLEFEPADDLSYPEDFPALDEEITVSGTFDSYQQQVDNGTVVYLVLRDAVLR